MQWTAVWAELLVLPSAARLARQPDDSFDAEALRRIDAALGPVVEAGLALEEYTLRWASAVLNRTERPHEAAFELRRAIGVADQILQHVPEPHRAGWIAARRLGEARRTLSEWMQRPDRVDPHASLG
jgi:hypothetical protein